MLGLTERPNIVWEMVKAIYSDGGCVGKNPSPHGGTWAFCYVGELDGRLYGTSGFVTPGECGADLVTNNLTELLALLFALEQLPGGWSGKVYTDSRVTASRFRKPGKSKFKGIPDSLRDRVRAARSRVAEAEILTLKGHPSDADLARGHKGGKPVSVHNRWCDEQCGKAAREYRRLHGLGTLPRETTKAPPVATAQAHPPKPVGFHVPYGTKCKVRRQGADWKPYVTTKGHAFADYRPADNGGTWVFTRGEWELKVATCFVIGRREKANAGG